MKKNLLLIILCNLLITAYSQTNVSGIISSSTTWSLANSPYIVTGNILVNTGVTLTIEPGVLIKFDSGKTLQNKGTLIAKGTSNNRIIFTSNQLTPQPGDWNNIEFANETVDATYIGDNYNSGTTIQYADILYAGGGSLIGSTGSLKIINSAIFIDNVNIKNSIWDGIYIAWGVGGTVPEVKINNSNISDNKDYGIYCQGGPLSVSNTTIENNTSIGIRYEGGASTQINKFFNNIIRNNSHGIQSTSNGDQIFDGNIIKNNGGGISFSGTGNFNLQNNFIVNNSGQGIHSHGESGARIINNNVIANNVSAVKICKDADYNIRYNQIIGNNRISSVTGDSLEGAAFNSYELPDPFQHPNADQSPVVLEYNTISHNVSKNATIITFNPSSGDPEFKSNNNNFIENKSRYEIQNFRSSSLSNINAKNNYWNTTKDSEIQAKIYDWNDDGSKGIVDYSGFLSSPNIIAPISLPVGLIKKDSANGVFLKWNKNKESDLAGYKVYYGTFDGHKFNNSIDVGSDTSYLLTGKSTADLILITAYDNLKDGVNDFCDGHESWYSEDALPFAKITNGDTIKICQGSKVVLRANKSNSYKYQWLLDDVNISGANKDSLEVSTAGKYQVKVTNINYVSTISNNSEVKIHQLSAQNSNSTIVCGASFTLQPSITYVGNNSMTYTWDADPTLSAVNIKNPVANTISSQDYKVSITDNVCSVTATLGVTVNPLTVNSGLDKSLICGGKVQFDNSVTNYTGSGTLTYIWSPKAGLNDSTLAQPTTEATTNTNFALQVLTPNGCIAKDTVKVTVNPLTINSGLDKSLICGGKVQFDNSVTNYTGSGALTYIWSPKAGLNDSTIAQPTAEVTANTNFALQVLTPNGCIAKDTVKVTVNPLTVNSGLNKSLICGGNVLFDNPVTNYTGSGTLTYIWSPKAGLNDSTIAQPTAEVTANTNFALQVLTPNGCIAKDTVKVTVNPLSVSANSISVACGDITNLDALTNYSGTGILTYSWSPSAGLSATNIKNPVVNYNKDMVYSVNVITQNGCSASTTVNFKPSVTSFSPSICMVTVNQNDKNVVVWQRTANAPVDTFFIYRESLIQTNKYDIIGKVTYADTTVFVDTASNAKVQSNKYKIAAKDVCGFVTEKSADHKTMHLTINKGIGNKWNLIWDQYSGLTVSSYKIYKGTTKTNLVEIGSTAGGNMTYTDDNTLIGDIYYQIVVISPQICTSLISTGYESSRSNIMSTSSGIVTGIENTSITETIIYPNPAFDKLYISNTHSASINLMIYDLQGKLVLSKQTDNGQVDISSLSVGFYTVRIIDNGHVMINKFVKQ